MMLAHVFITMYEEEEDKEAKQDNAKVIDERYAEGTVDNHSLPKMKENHINDETNQAIDTF